MIKSTTRLWLIALLVGWIFDLLFWQKTPGINFAIFVGICLLAGFGLAWQEGLRPAKGSLWLLLPLVGFTALSFLRQEPFSLFLDYVLTLSLLALFTSTFLGGRWVAYNLSDYVIGTVRLCYSVLTRPVQVYLENRRQKHALETSPVTKSVTAWRRWSPIVRGVLLTIPIVILFTSLLAAADPIFSQGLQNLTAFFNLEQLAETITRVVLILILAYQLAGVYLHALVSSTDKTLVSDKPWLVPFLGLTEASMVLGGVALLFISFVLIQIRYFFGGQANITVAGFTYADYARRGFGELIAVAVLSLLLYLGLSAITQRKTPGQRRIFSGMGALLIVLVGVILVSAFQRLLLYEQAYGFSRLRTYSHIFMIWLGFLLLFVMFLELSGRLRYYAFALVVSVLGFGLTVNLLNVDAFVVQQNIQRAVLSTKLDAGYLTSLSDDSIPALYAYYSDSQLPTGLHQQIAGILACQNAWQPQSIASQPWQSINMSRVKAQLLLQA